MFIKLHPKANNNIVRCNSNIITSYWKDHRGKTFIRFPKDTISPGEFMEVTETPEEIDTLLNISQNKQQEQSKCSIELD